MPNKRDLELGEIIFRRVDEFRYLGVMVESDGNVESEVGNRMQAGWKNWRCQERCVIGRYQSS